MTCRINQPARLHVQYVHARVLSNYCTVFFALWFFGLAHCLLPCCKIQ